MENLHPEAAALAAFIVSVIVHIAKHFNIDTPPDVYAGLIGCTMYVIQRLARKFFPPDTEQLQKQIDKNLTKGT